ncbi:MAG: SDR family NAD(P)-dependent oxidoreductase [Nitrososphaeraceae archaeon]|nr:SDR family NAD(P)-dependent oxidoreductase [Nitrososphaeraceae archaeon]
MANEFSGKRVLVTGGTAGIGRAVVSRLLEGGAKVVTTAREKTMDDENRQFEFVQADLSLIEGNISD